MGNYRIITDSSADLSPALVKELEVQIIPLEFVLDGKSYFNYPDACELSIKMFYELLRAGKTVTTMQVNVARFLENFEAVLKEGDDILYIAFSSGLSGTYSSSLLAASELRALYPERRIVVVDSLSASMGQGLLVYHAVMNKRAGMDLDSLEKWLIEKRLHLCHWFTVDDLHHLKKGGRVSLTAALLGTMLGIKPVLHMDDEGHLIPMHKVRGRRQSLENLVKQMEELCSPREGQIIFISHGDCKKDAEMVAELIRSKFKVKNIIIGDVGPVIGAHAGPGVVSIFFFGTQR